MNSRAIFLHALFPFMMAGMALAVVMRVFTVSDSHLIQLMVKGGLFAVAFSATVYAMIERKDREFIGWLVRVKLMRRNEA